MCSPCTLSSEATSQCMSWDQLRLLCRNACRIRAFQGPRTPLGLARKHHGCACMLYELLK